MEAGRLNHRITIQKNVKTRNSAGQPVETWEDFCQVWAEVQCTKVTAVDAEGAIQHEGLYKFYIRHRRGITAEMRILWDDGYAESPRIFTLVGPPADWKGERIGLTLTAKELV